MSRGKKGGSNRGGSRLWKRVAFASIAMNGVLALFVLFSRPVSGQEQEEEKVSAFVDTYFRTWSDQDMEGYKACFHPRAVIHYVDANGVPDASTLDPFIAGQVGAHAASKVKMREIPLKKEIEVDGIVARALVTWRLFRDGGEDTGVDYFTLIKTKTGWKIISLVFRKDH